MQRIRVEVVSGVHTYIQTQREKKEIHRDGVNELTL